MVLGFISSEYESVLFCWRVIDILDSNGCFFVIRLRYSVGESCVYMEVYIVRYFFRSFLDILYIGYILYSFIYREGAFGSGDIFL